MMLQIAATVSCLPSVWSHAFMTVPASRNLNQCTKSFPGTEGANACLANQDRSSPITGACEGLPCWGCNKLPKPPYRLTCTPGNHPGVYKIQNNVCGVASKSVFFGPDHGRDFQRDDPQVTWQAGSVVEVEVMYVANHLGNYQFRLCLDGSDTDECFNQMPLKFEDGQDWHWIPEIFMNIHDFGRRHRKDRIVLPEGVECDHCTLNWRWDTAQEASVFSNCADVAITSSRDHPLDVTSRDHPWDAVNVVTYDGLCLDIQGGIVAKGQPLWMVECSGTDTQQFTFTEDSWRSWRITPASDPSLCIDAGDMNLGNQIMLQECIGNDQQSFGYTSEVQSLSAPIYLAKSVAKFVALCLQPEKAQNSAAVTVTDCQEQNPFQQWSLSSTFSGLRAVSNQTHAEAWI